MFRPRSESVIANLWPSVRRTLQLRHGDFHASDIVPHVSVLTTQIKVFAHCISPVPATPRNLVCNALDSEELVYPENAISLAFRVFLSRHLPNLVPPIGYTVRGCAGPVHDREKTMLALRLPFENFPVARFSMLLSRINAITILTTTCFCEYVGHCVQKRHAVVHCNAECASSKNGHEATTTKLLHVERQSPYPREQHLLCRSSMRSIIFQI
jgi:hypothetical protein